MNVAPQLLERYLLRYIMILSSYLKCYKCLLKRNEYSKGHLHPVSLHCSFPIKRKKSFSLINTETGTINLFLCIDKYLLNCTSLHYGDLLHPEDLLRRKFEQVMATLGNDTSTKKYLK